ncbi:MAG TPA: DUF3000 domain-containing protein [Mycobacteriales bacterium]|nr:DUF3000 domain-containing protein [Mycobacteriales bacterium]
MSVDLSTSADLPPAFRAALVGLSAVELRPELVVHELPAPPRLAPHAIAIHAAVMSGDEELAEGRLVVLHDPEGQEVWAGDTRCVAYVQAGVEPDIANDPMLLEIGWTWLMEALESAGADYTAESGTVTRTTSERFGAISEHPVDCDVELRASWSPRGELGPHLIAFGEVLCLAAGLPPMPPGVVALPRRRAAKRTGR